MLQLARGVFEQIVAHCYDGLPLEACGLLGGTDPSALITVDGAPDPGACGVVPGALAPARAQVCYALDNVARSSRVYTVDPRQHLRADRDVEDRGLAIIGVFHSHTHTDAYPSPTDVAQAPDPSWHYVLVSLRDVVPVVRSYRIADGRILEEPVVLE